MLLKNVSLLRETQCYDLYEKFFKLLQEKYKYKFKNIKFLNNDNLIFLDGRL